MIPPIANNFVAGETAPGALDHVASLNDDGVKGILNLLGEHYDERQPADEDADQYIELVKEIDRSGLDCAISVKPSQIGLDVGDDVFVENLERIVAAGDDHGVFVWVDMEDYTTTDVTLDAYERLVTDHEAASASVHRQTSSGRPRTSNGSLLFPGRSGWSREPTPSPKRSLTRKKSASTKPTATVSN